MSRTASARSVGVLIVGICYIASRAQSPPSTANRVIAGVVVSAASGQTLGDADVMLRDTKNFKLVVEGNTDAEGRFSFPGLPDGRFALTAVRRGYALTRYEEHDGAFTAIVTGENLSTTGLTLSLPPLAAIYGTVTEDSGDPVPQARLSLYRQAPRQGVERIERAGQTMADAMGDFEFSSLAPDDYLFCVSGEPWYRQNRPPMVPGRGPSVNQPRSPLDVLYPLTCYPETTDPSDAEPISVKAGDRIQANVTLHPVPALHIFFQQPVTDPTRGFSMPQLRQQVFGFSDFVPVNQSVLQQPNGNNPGSATIEIAVAPGQYNLELQGSNTAQDSAQMASIDISSSNLTIDASSLRPLATVSGKVIVPGTEVPPDCRISLISEQNESVGTAAVAADGSFRMHPVAPGTYELQIAANSLPWAVTEIRTRESKVNGAKLKVDSDPVEITVIAGKRAGAVNGVVTHNGKPAGGIFVLLIPTSPSASRFAWMPNQSDSDGSFTFRSVLPGQYTVVAIEQGWTLDWRQPGVIDAYLASGVKIRVEPNSKNLDLQEPLEAQLLRTQRTQ
jgi:hypothetical protein